MSNSGTLREISRLSGVAVCTVSRVLNGKPQRVSAETRAKIEAAAQKLRYSPNHAARSLAKGRNDCVGVISNFFTDIVMGGYIERITACLAAKGITAIPMVSGADAGTERNHLLKLSAGRADGAVLLHYHHQNKEFYRKLSESGFPLVFRAVDVAPEAVGYDCAGIDINAGYRALCESLLSSGYRRIGVVGGYFADELRRPTGEMSGHAKVFLKTVADGGGHFDPGMAVACDDSSAAAFGAVTSFLSENPGVCDAVIVQNNNKALGVLRAVRNAGLRVPEDMGIAVISDSFISQFAEIPLTVWSQPVEALAGKLADMISRRILEPPADAERKPEKYVFSSEIIVRESTRRNKFNGIYTIKTPETIND